MGAGFMKNAEYTYTNAIIRKTASITLRSSIGYCTFAHGGAMQGDERRSSDNVDPAGDGAPRRGGTGSNPQAPNGWQRASRLRPSATPVAAPCTRTASAM